MSTCAPATGRPGLETIARRKMMDNAERARAYASGLDVSDVPTYGKRYLAAPPPRFVPQAGSEQAVIVGSHLQSFSKDVGTGDRETLLNAMLLAQLAAKKEPVDNTDAWYRRYFDVLTNIGLLVEEQQFRSSETETIQADVEKVVLEIAASLLGGPAATAYKVVEATLSALQKLDEDSPAITIFRRETHREVVCFQISMVHAGDDGLAVFLLAFTLEASASRTQVLFFKSKAKSAHVKHSASRLRVVQDALAVAAPIAKQKVVEHIDGYVRELAI
jgi:hypothetical protein